MEHRGHCLQLGGRLSHCHPLCHPLQGLQGTFTPRESACFRSKAGAEEG